MASCNLTAVQECVAADARLVSLQLQAQECIVQGRGRGSSSVPTPSLNLVSAVSSSSVLQAQHEQHLKQRSTHGGPPHASSVLDMLLQHWHGLMQERLLAAQMLLPDIPLVCAPRTESELASLHSGEDVEAWRQIGHTHSPWVLGLEAAPACIKLMYAADDLLHALSTAVAVAPCTDSQCHHCGQHSSSASDTCSDTSSVSSVHLTLLQGVRAPSRVWLQSFFAELQPGRRQVGLDDVLHTWCSTQQVQQAHGIAASCSAAACRAAARMGVPASARPWVWAAALGLPACLPADAACSCSCQGGESSSSSSSSSKDGTDGQLPTASIKQDAWWRIPNQRDTAKLELLCNAVKQQGLLVDVLTCADVQQMADNAHFFVFEEAMRALLLAFSRDASVMQQAAVLPHPVLSGAGASQSSQSSLAYPPSGVLPFQGLCAYLAPLCFLYGSPAAVYPVWHAMHCQYWCRLHSLSASPAPAAGLAVLCRTFLDLLQEVDAEVYQHLGSITSSPLDMVFPWLMSAFALQLAPAETLLLWDRVIGYDSLLPLPVLAVAILTFRRDLILAAETSEEVSELLQDLGQLRVVPLLQALLFDA